MSLKMFDENNLPHELSLTTTQKTKLRNALNNNMSFDLKFSKAQICKITQSEGFLGSLSSRFINESSCSFGKKQFSSTWKCSSCSSNWCRNSKENTWFRNNNFNNNKQKKHDIMEIIQALEDSDILHKGITKKLKMKQKNKNEDF